MKKNSILRDLAAKIGRLILSRAAASSLNKREKTENVKFIAGLDEWIMSKGWLDDLSMGEVAEILGVRQEQLSIFFHTQFGKSFLQWRRELRIEEAKRLLLEDKTMPTALVGETVGINDKSNFRRQFKAITGYTPAEWRRLEH
ncbi:MAG: AraC family transcriptional regulator [Bacteroidales bacterium]|nr:AraC family transcriptional regulator [Bacteroidales bacterium]